MGFNIAMKKKYLNITEAIKILARQSISIDVKDIHSCTRERIIHPLIHIDSAPVYACESHGEKKIAIGFCFLSAYIDAGDEIKAIFDTVVRRSSARIKPWLNKDQLIDCEIFSWSTNPNSFVDVPNESISLKLFSKNTINHISDFRFLDNDPFYVRIENLLVSQEDLQVLVQYYTVPNQKKLSSTTANSKVRKKDEAPFPNHHSKKRTQILRAAVAVVHRHRANIETGASIFKYIEGDISSLFGSTTLPLSGSVSIELINGYIKPLKYCNFNPQSRALSDHEKIWAAVLSLIHNNVSTDDEGTTIEEIKNCLNQNKKKLDLSDSSLLNSFDEELRGTLKLLT